MNELLLVSATELARRIRDGEVSSREVVEAHIAHIEAVNPTINAVVADRFEQALQEAEGPHEGPFAGVPCTIKECFALDGMPQTAGLPSRVGFRPSDEATAVKRIRASGAIPLGVTNLSELCMWMESDNRVYGRTSNPYDATRMVGGSSGGEGAIVGSGASPFGLGSDIGGSIRMPAFFCGVFGHKPTGGRVPGTGQYPIAHGSALRMLATGPLCRRAEDLAPLLRLLEGPDGQDSACEAMRWRDPAEVDLTKLRVLDVHQDGWAPVSRELREKQADVARHLAGLGAEVEVRSFEKLKHAFDLWGAALDDAGGPSFRELMGGGEPIPRTWELMKWAARRSDHTLPALLLACIEEVPKVMTGRRAKMLRWAAELEADLEAALGDDGVMLYPSHSRTAYKHLAPMATPFRFTYTAVINVLGLPATQVPLGLGAKRLPTGVQVVAARGNDHLCLAVALELERAFGGWVPPQ